MPAVSAASHAGAEPWRRQTPAQLKTARIEGDNSREFPLRQVLRCASTTKGTSTPAQSGRRAANARVLRKNSSRRTVHAHAVRNEKLMPAHSACHYSAELQVAPHVVASKHCCIEVAIPFTCDSATACTCICTWMCGCVSSTSSVPAAPRQRRRSAPAAPVTQLP